MPTISLTQFLVPAYVLVEVDWTDQPTVEYVKVVRRNTVTGELAELRPYTLYDADNGIALSCGHALFWDTEPPLNVSLEYCTYASDVPTAINSNTGFETGLAPWVGVNGAASQSGAFFHTGTFSALLVPAGTAGTAYISDTTAYTTLQTGVETVVDGWFFTPQGWNSAYISVQVQYDDGLLETFTSDIYPIRVSAWQLVRFAFTPSNHATILEIQAGTAGFAPNTINMYIDDVSLKQPQPNTAFACDTVTVASESVWLKNPLDPCLDVEIGLCTPGVDVDCEDDSRVSYAGMADDARPANTVLSEPANQIYPIPVNRTRRSPRSELRVITHDCDARDAVVAINQPGNPLLFQAPATYCIPDRYISVGELVESRISVDQREDFRLMSMPYAVVRRPEGPSNGICGARIVDLCDIYTSWSSMGAAGLTWVLLLLGYGSWDGPVNTLPEGFRIWDTVETEFANWTAVAGGGARDWSELRDGL